MRKIQLYYNLLRALQIQESRHYVLHVGINTLISFVIYKKQKEYCNQIYMINPIQRLMMMMVQTLI